MKNEIIYNIVGLVMGFCMGYAWCSYNAPRMPIETITAPERQITLDDLLDAIEQVESGGDANAVGDNGAAIGSFQIHRIYVRDVNRILGWNKFTYEDRWSRGRSRQMVRIYLTYYGETRPYEDMARIHNGGPNGYKSPATEKYWLKVKKVLEQRTK